MRYPYTPVKRLFLFFVLVVITTFSFAQDNSVAIGSTTTKANAVLWLNGNGSQGLLLPSVASTDNISSPDEGMVVYQTSDDKIYYRNALTWVAVGSGGSGGNTYQLQLSGNTIQLLENGSAISPSIDIQSISVAGDITGTIGATTLENGVVGISQLGSMGLGAGDTGKILQWNGSSWETADNGGASGITYSAGTGITIDGSNQISVNETDIDNMVADNGFLTSESQTAADVTYDNATSGLTATDVKSAIDELASSGTVNTDEQDLAFSGGQITLSGDPNNTVIDLSNYDSDSSDDFDGDFTSLTNVPANLDVNANDDLTTSSSINDLADVNTTGIADGKVLKASGGQWVIGDDNTGGTPTVDNTTIEINGSSQLAVMDGGITDAKIADVDYSKITNVPADLADGDDGITSVTTDASISGTGVSGDPLSVANFTGAGNGNGLVPDPGSSSGLFLSDDGTWQSAGAASLPTTADAQILISNGADNLQGQTIGGDITISNTGDAQLVAGTITNADINDVNISKVSGAGTMATQDATSVSITGGTITGVNIDAQSLQGDAIDPGIAPADGEILKWNSGTSQWEASADLQGSGGTLPTLADGQIITSFGADNPVSVTLSGDIVMDNTGVTTIGTGVVGSTEIADGSIANGDLNKSAIPISGFSAATVPVNMGNQVVNNVGTPTVAGDAATKGYVDAQIASVPTLPATTDAQIIVSSGTTPTAVTMNGDVTIDNAGTTTIATGVVGTNEITDGSIANGDLNKSAIPISGFSAATVPVNMGNQVVNNVGTPTVAGDAANKGYVDTQIASVPSLPATTDAQIIVSNGTTPTAVTMSGDVTIDNAGVTTIGTGVVGSTEIADGSIANGDLNKSAIPISGFSAATVPVNMGNQVVNNVGTPTVAGDAATKGYVDTQVSANALPPTTDAQIIISNGTTPTATTMSGDVTIDNAGVTTLGTGVVGSTEIADGSIATGDIASPGNDQVLTTAGDGTVQWEPKSNFDNIDVTAQTGILVGDGSAITGYAPTNNIIQKGNGTVLTSSNITDDGTTISLGSGTEVNHAAASGYGLHVTTTDVSNTDISARVENFGLGTALDAINDNASNASPAASFWTNGTGPTLNVDWAGSGTPNLVTFRNFGNPVGYIGVGGQLGFDGELSVAGDPGTNGQVLTSAGPGAPPTWSAAGSSSLQGAYDGGKTIQLDGTNDITISNSGATPIANLDNNGVFRLGDAAASINGLNLQISVDDPTTAARFQIQNINNSGDAAMRFWQGAAANTYSMGIDADDPTSFKIANGNDLSSNTRLVIDNTGKVAIGASSPAGYHLNLADNSSYPILGLNTTNTAAFTNPHISLSTGVYNTISAGTRNNAIWQMGIRTEAAGASAATDRWYVGRSDVSSQDLVVSRDGFVGVNNPAPTEQLDVAGNVQFTGALMPNSTAGTAGQVLTSAGPGAPPTWTAAGAAPTLQNAYEGGNTIALDGTNEVQISTTGGNTLLATDDTNQRLGIGTASPSFFTEIIAPDNGSTNQILRLTTANTNSFADLEGAGTGSGAFRIRSNGGSGDLIFQTGGLADRMVINNAGNVGIGTSTPQDLLHINGATTGRIRITNTTNGETTTDGLELDVDNSGIAHIRNRESGLMVLSTGGNDVMHISSSGYVGLNTNSPAVSLDIASTDAIKVPVGTDAQRPSAAPALQAGLLRFSNEPGSEGFEGYDGSSWVDLGGGGSSVWTDASPDIYYTGGNVGIGNNSPDEELVVGDALGKGWTIPAVTVGSTTSGGAITLGDGSNSLDMEHSNIFGYARISSSAGGFGNDELNINASNVGIGTSSFMNKLDVEGSLAVGASYSGDFAAPTNGMIVEGNVGIGTTSPLSHMQVGNNTHLFNWGGSGSVLTYNIYNNAGTLTHTTDGYASSLTLLDGQAGIYINSSAASGSTFGSSLANRLIVTETGVSINKDAPNPSAVLHLVSDLGTAARGFMMPSLATTDRDQIVSPIDGLMIYNETDHEFNYYNGNTTNWETVGGGSSGWSLTGNAVSTGDFIGTTNSEPLLFRQNNGQVGFINQNNVFLGGSVAASNSGNTNTGVGQSALSAHTSGNDNTAVGVFALGTNTTGSSNTAIGAYANVGSGNLTNATAIGASASVTQSNSLVLGQSGTNVGIGTSAPAAPLEVNGLSSFVGGLRVSGTDNGNVGSSIYLNANTKDWTITATNDAAGSGGQKFVIRDYTSANDRFTIDGTGNVGIGTTTPSIMGDAIRTLTISSGTGSPQIIDHASLELQGGSGSASGVQTKIDFIGRSTTGNSYNTGRIEMTNSSGSTSYGIMRFYTGGNGTITERMQIDHTGNIGIGTTAPTNQLSLYGTGAHYVQVTDDQTGTTAGDGLRLGVNGAGSGYIVWGETAYDMHIGTSTDNNLITLETATDNVGIGLNNPSEKLEVLGNIEISGEYKYATAKMQYLSLSAADFNPIEEQVDGNSTGNAKWFSTGTYGTSQYMFAPVHLPNGAVVTDVVIYVTDNDGTYEMSFNFQSLNQSLNNISTHLSSSPTSGTPGNTSLSVSGSVTIDNLNRAYFIKFNTVENASNLWIRGARVTYTVDHAD